MISKEKIEKKPVVFTTYEKGMLALAVGLVVSAFLPYASVTSAFVTANVTGVEGDGLLILILGAVLCLIILIAGSRNIKGVSSIVIGIVCLFICIGAFVSVSEVIAEYDDNAYVLVRHGIGLYLAGLCSIGLIVLGMVNLRTPSEIKTIVDSTTLQEEITQTTPRFCTVCGASIAGVKFCPECGTKVSDR